MTTTANSSPIFYPMDDDDGRKEDFSQGYQRASTSSSSVRSTNGILVQYSYNNNITYKIERVRDAMERICSSCHERSVQFTHVWKDTFNRFLFVYI